MWPARGPEADLPPPKIRLWMLIVAGPVLIALGIHTYLKLAEFEETGGRTYLNKFDKLLYNAGGKTAVLLVWCGLGAFYLFLVYRYFTTDRENKRRIAAAEERIAAKADEIAAAERSHERAPAEPPPRPPPPRIGDDPFRDPPGPKPIVVQKAEIASAPVPRASTPAVSSDAGDGPKFLK